MSLLVLTLIAYARCKNGHTSIACSNIQSIALRALHTLTGRRKDFIQDYITFSLEASSDGLEQKTVCSEQFTEMREHLLCTVYCFL